MEENNNQRTESLSDEQLVFQTTLGSNPERTVDSASGHQTKIFRNTDSQSQNSRKRKLSGFSSDPGMEIFSCCCPLTWLKGEVDFTEVPFMIGCFSSLIYPPPHPTSSLWILAFYQTRTGFIDRFHVTLRRPYLSAKQWIGGHIGVQKNSCGNWTLLTC